MLQIVRIGLTTILLTSAIPGLAEAPMSVEAALNYELPENPCARPDSLSGDANVSAPIQDSSGVPYFQGSSTASISDTDHYERSRLERKEKRWKKCLAGYKAGLLEDMERLKTSATHGLTEAQALTIVGHMKRIQTAYLSPDGLIHESAENPD